MSIHSKVRRTAQDWQHILEKFENSGLTQKQFCLQQNLALSTFLKWKNQLASDQQAPSGFVEICPQPSETDPAHSSRFELTVSWLNKLHCHVKFG